MALEWHLNGTSTAIPWHFNGTYTAQKKEKGKKVFFGIVASIRISREIQFLLYAGFLQTHLGFSLANFVDPLIGG